MQTLFTFARVAFVVIFIVSGATKLWDISIPAAAIASTVSIPTALAGLAAQAETMTHMTTPQLLAIATGLVELLGGLLIAFNLGTRWAALMLLALTAVATFYFHDFWNMTGEAQINNMIHAEKNLSIMAGLLVFFVLGSWRPIADDQAIGMERGQRADEYYLSRTTA
jgi:putative oxidoreductase